MDVDPGAVEIAKLRFWLSLIVDEESRNKISPLPNLDYKMVQCNSLLSLEEELLNNNLFRKLEKIRFLYFNETRSKKKDEYKEDIKELITKITGKDKNFYIEVFFSEIFHEKKGFDIVIGNPPYVKHKGLKMIFEKELPFYEKKYQSTTGRFDIYVLFLERAFKIINSLGKVSLILPYNFMGSDFGRGIRKFLYNNKAINSILHFGGEKVFDANVLTCIIGLSHNNSAINFKQIKPTNEELSDIQFETINYSDFSGRSKWTFQGENIRKIIKKLKKQPLTIINVFGKVSQGIVTGKNDIFIMKGYIEEDIFTGFSKKTGNQVRIEAGIVKPILKGEDIKKYHSLKNQYYVIYPHYEISGKTKPIEEQQLKQNFPLTYNYLLYFKEELIRRYEVNPKYWYILESSRKVSLFEQEKIITRDISPSINMTLDNNNFFCLDSCYSLIKEENYKLEYKYLLAILNSSVMRLFMSSTSSALGGCTFRYKTEYLQPFPLPSEISLEEQQPYINKVNLIMEKSSQFQLMVAEFIDLLQRKYGLENPTKTVLEWYKKEFENILKELKKKKIKLTSEEEEKLMNYFNKEKPKAIGIKREIDKIDKEIDKMVYELYELTPEEIEVIEGSLN